MQGHETSQTTYYVDWAVALRLGSDLGASGVPSMNSTTSRDSEILALRVDVVPLRIQSTCILSSMKCPHRPCCWKSLHPGLRRPRPISRACEEMVLLRAMLQNPLQVPGYLLIGLVLLPRICQTAVSNLPKQHSK